MVARISNEVQDGEPITDESPTSTFEVVKTNKNTNVLTSINPLTVQLTPQMINAVRKAVDADSGISFCSTWAQPYKDTAVILYWTYKSGAQEYFQSMTTLRKTYTVSNTYQVNESVRGAGRIYTKQGMINAENIPYEIHGILPDSYEYSTEEYNVPYVMGYFYSAPSYSRTGPTSYSVTSEYNYGAWPVALYGRFYA